MTMKRGKKLPMLRHKLHDGISVWEAAGAFRLQAQRQKWPAWEREQVNHHAVVSEGVSFLNRYCTESL